jgi:hypothetical protein
MDIDTLRAGRQQMGLIALGFYTTWIYGNLVMPNYSDDDIKTDVERAALLKKSTQKVF